MRQTAQVKRVLSYGLAEIAVTRQGACSHNCSDCGGCSTSVLPTVTANAENLVGADVGDLVLVETSSNQLLGVAAMVYLLPMVLLIAGYLAAAALGLSNSLCMLASAVSFGVSIGLILLLDRYVKAHRTFQFSIIGIQHS